MRILFRRTGAIDPAVAGEVPVSEVRRAVSILRDDHQTESLGHSVSNLRILRDELREVAGEVARRARRLSVLASHHRGVLADILTILGESSPDEDVRRAGVLVDAEA